jgi:hypothetical protein
MTLLAHPGCSLASISREDRLTDKLHPAAPHHLPPFITAPGDTDIGMVAMGLLLIAAVLAVGNIFFRLHSLPERMAHRSQKLQFEIVAVLGLLALFTHIHLFWVAALILALIDIPDFSTPLRSIAGSVEKIANVPQGESPGLQPDAPLDVLAPREATTTAATGPIEDRVHA